MLPFNYRLSAKSRAGLIFSLISLHFSLFDKFRKFIVYYAKNTVRMFGDYPN